MDQITTPFTVENIEKTLHQLYNDVQSQAQSNAFLFCAQESPEAWNFAWDLLHPAKPAEVQFFGASILFTKIAKHWNELTEEQYGALREKLLGTLLSYATGPKVILTRLCIAMASFILQTIRNFWPSAIKDLISTIQPQNIPNATPQQVAHVLLEVLVVLSEEFPTAEMVQAHRGVVRHALHSSTEMVMDLIESILSNTSAPTDLCELSLKCYSSWAQLGTSVFERDSLLYLSFDLVYREDVCMTALETLSNVANHPEAPHYEKFILKIVDHLTKFEGLLQKAIQDDDMEKCSNIYALVISVVENHCTFLISHIKSNTEKKDSVMKLIGFILQCSSTPGQYPVDEICSEQAFSFWYTLQNSINCVSKSSYERYLLIFHPVFQSLLDTYLVKVRYPPDSAFSQWKSDEKETFRCYRQDISDSLLYCFAVLQHAALANLIAHLSLAINMVAENSSQWQYLEACLFAFKAFAEEVENQENCYIPQFLSQLRSVPLDQLNLKVISGIMEAIGAYAHWVNSNPSTLEYVVPILLQGVQNAEVAPSATFALKDITQECSTVLQPFAERILYTSQEALNGNILKSREKVRLMSTIGRVLSIMPYSYVMSYLELILAPIFDNLPMQLQSANCQDHVALKLHMLSNLFGNLDRENDKKETESEPLPTLLVLQKLISIFRSLGKDWNINEQVIEALSYALKPALSSLGNHCCQLIPDILELVLSLYKWCPHCSLFTVAMQLLFLYNAQTNLEPQLVEFFAGICNHVTQLPSEVIREETVNIAAFFHLLEKVLKLTVHYFKSSYVNPRTLFQFGCAALNFPEKPTVKAAAEFLAEFIMKSRKVPAMQSAVFENGENLVMQMLKMVGGDVPRVLVDHVPGIMMVLKKKYFDDFRRWMMPFTEQDGFPSPRVNRQQKEHFTRLVLKQKCPKMLMKVVIEFTLLCRGIIGSEYVSQGQPI